MIVKTKTNHYNLYMCIKILSEKYRNQDLCCSISLKSNALKKANKFIRNSAFEAVKLRYFVRRPCVPHGSKLKNSLMSNNHGVGSNTPL